MHHYRCHCFLPVGNLEVTYGAQLERTIVLPVSISNGVSENNLWLFRESSGDKIHSFIARDQI